MFQQHWSRIVNEIHEWIHQKETTDEEESEEAQTWIVVFFFADFSWSRLIENLSVWVLFLIFDLWCFDLNRKEFFL